MYSKHVSLYLSLLSRARNKDYKKYIKLKLMTEKTLLCTIIFFILFSLCSLYQSGTYLGLAYQWLFFVITESG